MNTKYTTPFCIIPKTNDGSARHRAKHGGNSKGTTCVVDRDVTAYLVVDRVLRFPTEHYGCRYGDYPGFNDVKVIFRHIFCYFTFRICF